ncbi:MAG: Miniconductance mechanosensitive channel MscM precursor [Syntrophorhabdus sp. PtaU1.Bin050]|nr:MAG: Miniconductance mechanosensitive channel MscM precursor [Syntrophorhabdus sp. PtaU1.Bin050]
MKRCQLGCLIVLALIFVLSNALPAQPVKSPSKATPSLPPPKAEVKFDNQVLFEVRDRVLSFSPKERAEAITARIEALAKDPALLLEEIKVIDSDQGAAIGYRDRAIMTVTDGDARAVGKPRLALAQEYTEKIRKAIEERQARHSVRSIVLGVLFALLGTVVLMTVLIIFRKIFPRIYGVLGSWKGTRIRSIKIQALEILTADRIVGILTTGVKGIRVFLTIILFYFYIPLVFSFFPWTRGYAGLLFGYLVYPFTVAGKATLNYLPNLFFLAVIGVVTYYIVRLVRFFFNEIEKGTLSLPGFYQDWAAPTYRIARFLLIVFAAVMAFPYLPGSESPAFKGISIFLGVLFSLGSTSAVANVVAGIILNYTRAFSVGDRVKIGDVEGDITYKSLLVTHIRTIKNVEITLPNASVLNGAILNFSAAAKNPGLILNTSVTIGYDAPWRRVHELLIAAAKATNNILENPPPFVLQTALNDFYVSYQINAYTDRPHRMAQIYSDLHQNIQDKFNEGGVEIMSPHYSQLRDGNATTIPEQYRPPGYMPSGLRITQTEDKNTGK